MAGVIRDRTNLYITFRQSFSHYPSKKRRFLPPSHDGFAPAPSASEETRGLISSHDYDTSDGDAVIEMDLLPPRWLDIQDEVTSLLDSIARKSAELDKLHHKHVLPGFDDEEVKAEEERKIERMTGEITRGFHECQGAIARIGKMVEQARTGGGVGKGEEVMARNIQISLAGRVQDASAGFRKKQSNYLRKLRTLGGLGLPTSSPSIPQSSFVPDLLDSETDKSFGERTLQQTRLQTQRMAPSLTTNDAAIATREREINEIASGIIELADIFKDLQTLVIDQGTMLDRIDYNIDNMNTNVKEAEKELVIATGYQKKYTKRKILFLLFLLVLGMVILLSIKLGSRGGGGSKAADPPPENQGDGAPGRAAQTQPQPQMADPLDIADPNG